MHNILNNHNRRLQDELIKNSGRPDMAFCNCRSFGRTVQFEKRRIPDKHFPMEHTNDGGRAYIGISAGNWKQRLNNHILFPIHDLGSKPLYLNIFGTLKIRADLLLENSQAVFYCE